MGGVWRICIVHAVYDTRLPIVHGTTSIPQESVMSVMSLCNLSDQIQFSLSVAATTWPDAESILCNKPRADLRSHCGRLCTCASLRHGHDRRHSLRWSECSHPYLRKAGAARISSAWQLRKSSTIIFIQLISRTNCDLSAYAEVQTSPPLCLAPAAGLISLPSAAAETMRG